MAKNPKVFPAFFLLCWLSTLLTKAMTVQALPSPARTPADDKLLRPPSAVKVMEIESSDDAYGIPGVPQPSGEYYGFNGNVGDFEENPENSRIRSNKRRLRAQKRRLRLYKKNYSDNTNEVGQEDLYGRDSRAPRLRFYSHDLKKREASTDDSGKSGDAAESHEHSRKRRSVLSELAPLSIERRSRSLSINNDLQVVADMIIASERRRRYDEMDRLRERLRKLGKRSDLGLSSRTGLEDDSQDVLSALKENLELALAE